MTYELRGSGFFNTGPVEPGEKAIVRRPIINPDVLLEEIRIHAVRAAQGEDVRRHERHLRWAFDQLDTWLTRGGILPKDWNHAVRTHPT